MNYRVKDMKDKKFSRLKGLEYAYTKKDGAYWIFVCECGNQKTINASLVRQGKVMSCGCYASEKRKKTFTSHGMSNTRTYNIWVGMKQRCLNPKNKGYKNYGERGILIEKNWLEFENFISDMGECPKDYTIERLDNEKNYSKENCIWANRSTQNTNKRYLNKTTGIKNISYNERDKNFSVGISRDKKRFRKDFKNLEDAIQWKEKILNKLDK